MGGLKMNSWEEILDVDNAYEVELNSGELTPYAVFQGVTHPSGKTWLVFESDGKQLLRNPSYISRIDLIETFDDEVEVRELILSEKSNSNTEF